MAATCDSYRINKEIDRSVILVTGLTNVDTTFPHTLAEAPFAVLVTPKGATAGSIIVSSTDDQNVTLKSDQAGGMDCYVECIAKGPHSLIASK